MSFFPLGGQAPADLISRQTVEYIGGIEVIKAFNQADNSYRKFTDAVHANADLILDWMKDTQKYSAIMILHGQGEPLIVQCAPPYRFLAAPTEY